MDRDQVIVIKNSVLAAGKPDDFADFWSFKEFVENADFTDESQYAEFENLADTDSIIDYFATRMFLDEGMDWPNVNTCYWKTRTVDDTNEYSDGRWRCINFDNNLNIHYDSVSDNTFDVLLNGNKNHKRSEIFYKLMQNPGFKKRFRERFLEIVDTTFDSEYTIPLLERYAAEIRPYIEADYKRFYGGKYSLQDFDAEIEEMKRYMLERADWLVSYVEEAY